VGSFKNGGEHGHGVMTWPNGSKYDGNWKGGKRHGRGVMTWPNGSKYDGNWKGGKRHGRGVEFDKDGKKLREGIWERGNFIGWLQRWLRMDKDVEECKKESEISGQE